MTFLKTHVYIHQNLTNAYKSGLLNVVPGARGTTGVPLGGRSPSVALGAKAGWVIVGSMGMEHSFWMLPC